MKLSKKERKERFRLLRKIDSISRIPLIILGFVWIILVVLEIVQKDNALLRQLSVVIWVIFIIDFLIKFIIAPSKLSYLKKNTLIIVSLIVPAFRIFALFRILSVLKLTRGLILIRLITSVNHGMSALNRTLKKRAWGFVLALTFIIWMIGSVGMYVFERNVNEGLNEFTKVIWWTAMLLITMGTGHWPVTPEGKFLCILLSLYGFSIFGYATATFATFFIDEDEVNQMAVSKANAKQLEELKNDIQELKELIKNNKG
jgi:voltage-gated potassium channel